MKSWFVTYLVDCSVTIEVEAETKEAALALADEKVYVPRLCHQCAGKVDMGDITEMVEVQENK